MTASVPPLADRPPGLPPGPSAPRGEEAVAAARRLLAGETVAEVKSGAELAFEAADRGDAEACTLAAALAAAGVGRPRCWDAALDHLCRGAELGSASAQGQLRVLAPRGVESKGAGSKGAGSWGALRRSIDTAAWGRRPDRVRLCEAPRIRTVAALATPAMCGWIIDATRALLQPALVFDAQSGAGRPSADRSNASAILDLAQLDVVILVLRERLALATGMPVQAMERPQVLRYRPGESFGRHYDFLDTRIAGYAEDVARHGQRVATALVYLNDGYVGGETGFTDIGFRHRGVAGDALVFANVDEGGAPDLRSAHSGEAVVRGEKWVFSQWVRDRAVM